MNIYFHVDEMNRDAITASAFSKVAKANGWRVILGNRNLGTLLPYFEKYFDVVILPKPTFFTSFFDRSMVPKLKSKYVMLYTEQIGIMTSNDFPQLALRQMLDKEYMSGDTRYVDKVSAFCFWSNQARKIVVGKFPELESRSHVVGHPRHDLTANPIINKSGDRQNKSIGIVTRAVLLNDYFGRNPLENIVENLKNVKIGGVLEYENETTGESFVSQIRGSNPKNDVLLEAIDFENMVLVIEKLLLLDYKISLKLHPKEDPDLYHKVFGSENMNVRIAPSGQPFANWAQHQKYVIGPPSTSFYDAFLVGTLPISTSLLNSKRSDFVPEMYEDKNQLMNEVFKPTDFQELVDFVTNTTDLEYKNLLQNPRITQILRNEVNYPYQTESLDRLARVIRNLGVEKKKSVRNSLGISLFVLCANLVSEFRYPYLRIKEIFSGKKYLNSASFIMNFANRRRIRTLSSRLDLDLR